MQSQKAVSAYFTSKQTLPFDLQNSTMILMVFSFEFDIILSFSADN